MSFELPETLESRSLFDVHFVEIVPNDRADIIGKLPIPM
jgi:hypothetical protein